jgi:hypothetical protein
VQKLLYLGVKFPRFIPAIKYLARLNIDPIYDLVFIGSYFARYLGESGSNFFHAVWLGLRNLKNY